MRKIRVTLEIEVEPLTREEMEDAGFEGEDAEPVEVDAEVASEVGEAIVFDLPENEGLFSGSDLFVKVKAAELISYEVVDG